MRTCGCRATPQMGSVCSVGLTKHGRRPWQGPAPGLIGTAPPVGVARRLVHKIYAAPLMGIVGWTRRPSPSRQWGRGFWLQLRTVRPQCQCSTCSWIRGQTPIVGGGCRSRELASMMTFSERLVMGSQQSHPSLPQKPPCSPLRYARRQPWWDGYYKGTVQRVTVSTT